LAIGYFVIGTFAICYWSLRMVASPNADLQVEGLNAMTVAGNARDDATALNGK
jgi:hypothetical protein